MFIKQTKLPLLSESERHQLLIEWNNTQVDYPKDKCIHQLFEEQVEKTPDAVAVVFDSEQLTYRELNSRANQLARYLQKLGVKPESLVGICVERSVEMMVGLLGILKAGGAYVPLDPVYPQERVHYILSNSQAKLLITSSQLLSSLPNHETQVICIDKEWEVIALESRENPESKVKPNNLSYAIFTSGSTGKPKGVEICHQSLVNFINSMGDRPGLKSSDRLLALATICFDIHTLEIYQPLTVGATIILVSRKVAQDPLKLAAKISQSDATVMQATPATWQMLLFANWSGKSDLKAICGGEALPKELANSLLEKVGSLWNLYGPTETTVWSTIYEVKPNRPTRGDGTPELIGRPIANTEIYILDKHLQPVPIGVPGELHIGGAGLARGYLNRPKLTEQKFIPNPFEKSKLYKTGDLARYLPDGNIEYLGRIDRQVKIRGFRIELGEIEALLAQHSNVQAVVVIAREDIPGDKRLVAYLTTNEAKTTISDLRFFLKTKLPEYMIPAAFVFLESIPLTPNGKVNRRALPVPDTSSFPRESSLVAPRNLVEMQLAQIWSDILGVSPIGVRDNFIELGGDSLLATKIIGLVSDRFQVELLLNYLFEYPTVAELAQKIVTEVAQKERSNPLPSLEQISRQQTIPLSFAQEQLWFITQLAPCEPIYNESFTIHLGGDINVSALSKSLTELIRRHEILRSTFRVVNEQPVQEIHSPSALTLPFVELRSWPETKRETEALRIAIEQLRTPFDLARGPLLRATLIQFAETDYRLDLAMHHIVMDGESLTSIFLPELETIYTAFSQGLPSPLPELTIQYADFSVWQQQWLQGEIISNQLAYWEKQLENLPQLQLPTDRPQTPKTTFAGSRLCFTLSKDLTEKLKTISRKEGVTLFMTLAAAIEVLLYRYSAQEDIVIGTVTSQRNRPELQGVMGDFLNTLVLRSDLSGNPNFREFLKRVRNVILSAYANQDVPFDRVVNALHPDRHFSQNPLFQVMLVLQPPFTDSKLGWTVSQLEVDSGTSKFNLTFNLEERPEGIIGAIEYNTDLFDAATIDRAIGHLITLLEGIVAHPETSIAQLPLLTEVELHQLLVEWNDTAVNYPYKCIHQLFEEQVEKTPDAVAVVFEEQKLTYQELNCRANQLAHYLQTLGVKPETLVGICVERSLAMVVALLGILKAGGAYVPIDPNYPAERIAYMLEDSAVPVLLTSKSVGLDLPEHSARVVCLDSDWDTIVSYSIKNIDSGVTPKNLAYVIYTSGSTGKPKGTMIMHTGVVNYLSWLIQAYQLTQGNGFPVNSSIAFDLTISSLYPPLLIGQKVILLPEQDEIEALSQLLSSHENLSLVKITPAHLQILNSLIPPEKASNQTRALMIGGEVLPLKTVSFWSNNAPETKVINEYGPTETVVGCCVYPVKPEECDREIVPIGRPIANTKIYILDSNNQPVPIGVPGELHIGGAGLGRGYLNRPQLTEQKFIANPFQNSKLYKTGDLARYLPDGNIEFLGRIDRQVKIRGFRIELGEIEAVLAQHSNVREVVVIAREDIPGDKRLVAYLVPNDAKTTINDLRSFLKTKLPEYMIPAAFVFLESLPLTPNGKINRHGLPIPAASSLVPESSLIDPRDSLELQLAQIWSEILGVSPIGVRDNFFDLGGHSLLAVRLMAEIEKQFDKNLSLAALFQGATVEQLAILLRQSGEAERGGGDGGTPRREIPPKISLTQKADTHSWSALVAIQPQGNQPPFFCMPGSGGNVVYFHQLARHLGNDRPFYALQPPSLDGVSEPFGSVEEVAAYYLKAIQTIQPSGPYFLGGHSFGVLVAFEIAQQLQQQGETVALLALLDLPARLPGRSLKQLDWDDTRWFTNIAHILEILSGKNLGISYETLKPLNPEAQLNYLKQQMETVNLLPYNSGIERVRGIVQTIKGDELAFMSYILQKGYQGRISLFRTSEVYQDKLGMFGEIPSDPTWGWNQLSTQPVEVHVVPGSHTTMLSEPHVQVLAELLKLCYQKSSSDF